VAAIGGSGPFLRLDHSADEALRAVDTLLSRWERFERARRRRLFVLPPLLVGLALSCVAVDAQVGFGLHVYGSFAPLLLAAALTVPAATHPPGPPPARAGPPTDRAAARPRGARARPSAPPAPAHAASASGLEPPARDPARRRGRGAARVSRLVSLIVALATLGAADAAIASRLFARLGTRVTRWSWAVPWSAPVVETKTWHL
jgi:hypothetical protein